MPDGILGSRANLLIDLVLACNLVAPFWAYGAARMARAGRRVLHMRLQLVLWAVLFVNVLVLEGWIRFSGGSGSLIAESAFVGTPLMRWVFILHIGPATLTYVGWLVLVVTSFRNRHRMSEFPRHPRWGMAVIVGLVWTAISALAVYYLGFVA